MIQAFERALPVLERIEEAGFEAYFVGGSVRDFLLGKEIEDVDIATSATPEEIKTIFPKTIDVGIKHGTVIVLFGGQSYEVTTFRSESDYRDYRRPEKVCFIRNLEEDLQRRDFTMNAIAMNKQGEILDPFQGKAALEKKTIKTVGSAKDRFQEDALRMMRAVRFVSQLSFSIEETTFQALIEYSHLLANISVERILAEFEKLLLGKDLQRAISVLIDTELYRYLPGFEQRKEELRKFSHLPIEAKLTIEEYWVLLLYTFSVETEEVLSFLRKWKQPVRKMKRIQRGLSWLYERLKEDWTIEKIYMAKEELVFSTEKLFNVLKGNREGESIPQLKERINSLPIKSRNELQITGRDLIDWYGVKGGPWVEVTLQKVESAVLKRVIKNRKDIIREWLFKCNQN